MSLSLRTVTGMGCAALLVFAGIGCSEAEGPDRVSVSGTVTVDGKPLSEGEIMFRPEDKTLAAEAVKVIDGEFSGEVIPGPKRVEIRGYETVTPDLPANAPEAGTPIQKQILPPRYNDKSEITKEIDGSEPLTFELTTGAE